MGHPQPRGRVADERFPRKRLMDLVGSFDQVFAVKAANEGIRCAGLAKEGSDRVAKDDEPLARGDDGALRAMAAGIMDDANIIAKLRDPLRPFLGDGRRSPSHPLA